MWGQLRAQEKVGITQKTWGTPQISSSPRNLRRTFMRMGLEVTPLHPPNHRTMLWLL